MIDHCPVCGAGRPAEVLHFADIPVLCNQLWSTRDAARHAPVGAITLCYCSDCAFVWNRDFDPARMAYAPGYENALHHSQTFRTFAEDLARHLVDTYDLKGGNVAEIGCGDGYFLDLMVRCGAATATGFDPSMAGRTSGFANGKAVRIVAAYFDVRQLDRPVDLVVCRHVLEHLDSPVALLKSLRTALGDRDVPIYFEVPNAEWMMERASLWDVIYEHVGYWSRPSIVRAFREAGFAVRSVRSGYAGQFLMVEARPGAVEYRREETAQIFGLSERFGATAEAELARWSARLAATQGATVIWGAGSKGITFANALGAAGTGIGGMIDLNPRKHGLFAPGVATEIVPPEALPDLAPDLLVVSNALYQKEISEKVRALGVSPEMGILTG